MMYDIFTLIEIVESKPCLWDKTIADYRNKTLRTNAWHEICLYFEPLFDEYDDKKKDEILNSITNKWNNTRDYFMKSLKTKSGQAQKKQYVYHKHLQFLLKIMKEDSTTSNIVNSSQDNANESRPGTSASTASLYPSEDSDNESRAIRSAISQPISTPESSQDSSASGIQSRKKRLNPVDREILKVLQSREPRQDEFEDEDKAFLMSILPTIKRISEDDRLQFRIDVMQMLHKYTKRTRTQSSSSTHGVNSPINEVALSPRLIPLSDENEMPTHGVNSPINEVTLSPRHIPLSDENEMPTPPPHAPFLPPTFSPQIEIEMTPPPPCTPLSPPTFSVPYYSDHQYT